MSGLRCMFELRRFKTKQRLSVDLNAHCGSALENTLGSVVMGFSHAWTSFVDQVKGFMMVMCLLAKLYTAWSPKFYKESKVV